MPQHWSPCLGRIADSLCTGYHSAYLSSYVLCSGVGIASITRFPALCLYPARLSGRRDYPLPLAVRRFIRPLRLRRTRAASLKPECGTSILSPGLKLTAYPHNSLYHVAIDWQTSFDLSCSDYGNQTYYSSRHETPVQARRSQRRSC